MCMCFLIGYVENFLKKRYTVIKNVRMHVENVTVRDLCFIYGKKKRMIIKFIKFTHFSKINRRLT